jgi:ABC-type nitrate/sulfonate/bicarbonate transport system substrate-binding protein
MKVSLLLRQLATVFLFLLFSVMPRTLFAQQPQQKSLEKIRLAVPARALTYLPFYFGKSKGVFAREGIDLETIVMRPPIGVNALSAGDVDYAAATGTPVRAAVKGLSVKALMFIQTRLSFSLVGQPGMTPTKIKDIAVSGIGSLAYYGALAVLKTLGREGSNDRINYIATNTTANSYMALMAKSADAAILTPPYTSMATLAGFVDLGNAFDMRDLQGGLVVRTSRIQSHREQIKAMIRGILRSTDLIINNEPEAIQYVQNDFRLDHRVATDVYRILKQLWNLDGDIEESVLKSIIDRIRAESNITAEVPVDRVVDLSLLREVRAELRRR